MKKTYITPSLQITKISCEKMVAESYGISNTVINEDAMVKGQSSSSSSSRYNVWDDDWSAE